MIDHIILDKAWNKAVENGWKFDNLNSYYGIIFSHEFAKAFWGEKQPICNENGVCLHCGVFTHLQPPFKSGCNHGYYPNACDICNNKNKDWKYHLKQMVLETEPLKYLEKFL